MARIVLVYNTQRIGVATPVDMARIQLVESARALARLGHEVDIATAEPTLLLRRRPMVMAERLRRVALSRVRWHDYDAVETNFHQGWETLSRYGGSAHPFIIAKLGSVVGSEDMAGIYYYGADRERMFETQRAIHDGARFITLLTRAAQHLWTATFGARPGHLLVPGAAAQDIPAIGRDPYPARETTLPSRNIRVLFAGNLYDAQPEANRVLASKLNVLGGRLGEHGRLYFVGAGSTHHLDPRFVTNLGVVPYEAAWQHMFHADVGIVVSAGSFMHNNESTKIYHYLRAALPTVTESGFPNDHVVTESGLGYVVPSGDVDQMLARILEAARTRWDREAAVRYILANHTWEARMSVYDDVLRRHFPDSPVALRQGIVSAKRN
jgi:hypothetical protein